MDKLAAGIIDKLSIVGFFNVIISGSVLLYGISPILDRYAPDIFYLKLGLEKDIEKAIVACLMCYLFGCALQSIQEFSFKWLKSNIASRCLATIGNEEKEPQEKPIISNAHRRVEVTELAEKLFKKKNQGTFDPNNKEMCSYFIDYCEYSNSVKGYGSKASRYSESATFFEQLAVAFRRAGDVKGMVADALDVGRNLEARRDDAQVVRHGLLLCNQEDAVVLDAHDHVVDVVIFAHDAVGEVVVVF